MRGCDFSGEARGLNLLSSRSEGIGNEESAQGGGSELGFKFLLGINLVV